MGAPVPITGTISHQDLLILLPLDNLVFSPHPSSIVLIDLSGPVLKEALENSFSQMQSNGSPGTSFNRFSQVAGIEVYADVSKPVGERVTQVLLSSNGSNIDFNDAQTTYRVAIILSKNVKDSPGGDYFGYWDIFAKGSNISHTNIVIFKAVSDFIRVNSPLNYKNNCTNPERIFVTHK